MNPEDLNQLAQCTPHPRSLGVVMWEIVTGERPQRGSLRMPRVPEECPQASLGGLAACLHFVWLLPSLA